jgi:hypothetical protein
VLLSQMQALIMSMMLISDRQHTDHHVAVQCLLI